jgi:hypothetical protein
MHRATSSASFAVFSCSERNENRRIALPLCGLFRKGETARFHPLIDAAIGAVESLSPADMAGFASARGAG